MTGMEVNIAGWVGEVVSPADAEKCAAVVCARKGTPTPFDDNLEADCSVCGHAVIFRPYMPQLPPKICVQCAVAMLEAEKAVKQ